jgi:predicted PurR-regulated permease PerM
LALVIAVVFLAPFFGIIVTSLIVAFSFSPVHKQIKRYIKSDQAAAGLTLVAAILTVVLPVMLVVSVTISQAQTLASDIQSYISTESLRTNPTAIIDNGVRYISSATGGIINPEPSQIQDSLASAASQLANRSAQILGGLIGSVPGMVTAVVLFVYIFLGVLTQQKALIRFIKKLNPLGDDVADLYLERAGAMTNGMVRGQFVIALAQGVIGAITLWVAGVPYVAFLFIALTFLSIIPLGGGILSIPIGIGLLLIGNIWQGLVVLLGHFLLVANVDNLLRPALIPKEARLPSALTLLSVFAGLAMFGFLGIIIGPIVMILIVTTLEVYASVQEGNPRHTS